MMQKQTGLIDIFILTHIKESFGTNMSGISARISDSNRGHDLDGTEINSRSQRQYARIHRTDKLNFPLFEENVFVVTQSMHACNRHTVMNACYENI